MESGTLETLVLGYTIIRTFDNQRIGVMKTMDRFRERALQDHIIICYYSQVGESVADEFKENGQSVVVIELEKQTAEILQAGGGEVLRGTPPTKESFSKRIFRRLKPL